MIPLQGTLEVVLLKGTYRPETATGYGIIERNGQTIYVANGTLFLGQEILVRTDTLLKGGDPFKDIPTLTAQTGYFVTSEIPQEMKDGLYLPPDKYIFTGILPWNGNWPVLKKVNRRFRPGDMISAPYFPNAGKGGMLIRSEEPDTHVKNYQEAIKHRLRMGGRRHARVILVGSAAQISELEFIIRNNEVLPVRMEPLPLKKAEPIVSIP